MFGNLLGWIISAVIAVVALFIGQQVLQVSRPTSASGWVAQTVKPLGLEDTARLVLPPMNNLKDNAGDLYRQAAADYERSHTAYDGLKTATDLKEIDYAGLMGIDAVVKAGACPSMDLFRSKPEEAVGFATNVTVLDNLEKIALAMEQVVVLAKLEKQNEIARTYAQALLVLGYHLYQERVAYVELSKGESILGAANQLLVSLDEDENQNDKRAAQMAFDSARKAEFTERIDPVRAVITAIGQQNIIDHAGDYYQMAADATIDPVWRVEAIRRIGRLHFNAENKADQLKSHKVLGLMSSDPSQPPLIRAAATAALNMTVGDNQANR